MVRIIDDWMNNNDRRADPVFKDYYGMSSISPTKKVTNAIAAVAEKVQGDLTSDGEPAPVKKQRRKTTANTTDEYAFSTQYRIHLLTTTSSTESTAVTKTPAPSKEARRSSILGSQSPALSPKVITDLYDTGSTQVSRAWKQAYDYVGAEKVLGNTRDLLSGPWPLIGAGTFYEIFTFRRDLIPFKKFTEISGIPFIYSDKIDINMPDMFQILDTKFWAPFLLFLFTSTIIPMIAGYFINISFKHTGSSPAYGTRRATASKDPIPYDPFIFSIAKGLICYVVYAQHFNFFGLWSDSTVAYVNRGVYGGYTAMLTSAGIGAAASLYDAVLKK